MGEFRMPALGADMVEGTLTEWLVKPGDVVAKGAVIAVIETSKSDIEVEVFEAGTVTRLLAEPGDVLPVGAPLAVIGEAVESAPVESAPAESAAVQSAEVAAAPAAETVSAATEPPASTVPAAVEAPPPGAGVAPLPVRTEVDASAQATRPAGPPHLEAGPLVRHLAHERGIDLATVHGTGRGGRVTRADVEQLPPPGNGIRIRATPYARRLAAELRVELATVHGTGRDGAIRAADVRGASARRHEEEAVRYPAAHKKAPERRGTDRTPQAAPAPTVTAGRPAQGGASGRRTAAMRRAIAELMSRSKREVPHYYLSTTIDLTAATQWLHRANRDRAPGERLVPAALLLAATARAAREVPELNGFWQEDAFVPADAVHLAVAVSLRGGGLLTPVIHDADRLSPQDLMARLKDLVQRARRGRLRASELSGGTLTVSNLGDQGVESVLGVIHPPQVALAGFGAVVERPWAYDGMLGVRPVVTATLSGDHRATDGAVGARFLTAVDRLLQNPEGLAS
ncbi:2-oxo acid dehydrogenase subunit E2 [Streptomyces sp. TRM66268-LWL]|uniref:Dihydrolipoamide acetyltransferase component of pyruvate dehydrogenase complex n=1 Tax=Streptomyces polyasparticus TaxID=2767826 RepID=A0ABR7SLP8_9ACTN|nr:2-oxo acid dehydrogenase subunit E2 [Streptomyces polyasparticus]MBC9715922.1 2-oxo acid dehydrogenase subunit E2 [Streptomyces polyasparticus]